MNTSHTGSGYMSTAYILEKRKVAIEGLVDHIKIHLKSPNTSFDTIVFTGMSGALIAPSVADALDIRFLMIRKESDHNHSGFRFEGHSSIERYAIIDDFVSTGNTILNIIANIKEKYPIAQCVAIYTYNDEQDIRGINNILDRYPDIKVYRQRIIVNEIGQSKNYYDYQYYQ